MAEDKVVPEYQQRVIDEQAELAKKANALTAFLATDTFEKLPDTDKELLGKQLAYMAAYNYILKVRISLFK